MNPSGGLWNCAGSDVHPVVPGSTGRREPATSSASPQASTQPVPTLGHLAGALAHGSGFGQIRPPAFSTGGDATGAVGSIVWSSWDGPTATGTGTGEYVAAGQSNLHLAGAPFARDRCGISTHIVPGRGALSASITRP